MQKTRSRNTRLSLRRETLRSLNERDLSKVGGGIFTDDCSTMPSHGACSMPCTFSCLPDY